ncbi:MAG: hypothetical protein CL779_00140 [Chloroflexi bacterium]|nr:hypothetical protein [Chloroflexota bacterium]
MNIGFIVGKNDEVYDDDSLYNITPKKYLQFGNLNTDVAICMVIKQSYPDVNVDIILPREISLQRLKKNKVNFILGYDCIDQLLGETYVKNFAGKDGYKKLYSIYSKKSSKIFPPIEFLDFIWKKDLYLNALNKKKIPITPTITIKNTTNKNILQLIQKKKWNQFIIKPVGGTIAIGVGQFHLKECLEDPLLLKKYFEEYKELYNTFLIQELIKGFKTYGEIKMFWINGKYSYCVNTPGANTPDEDYSVKIVKNKKIINECIKIGEQCINTLPKIKVGKKIIKPVLVRTDFTCCKKNKKHIPSNYFLNEIEHQDAGSYINFENIKYPYVEIMADNYVKKAYELVNAGF